MSGRDRLSSRRKRVDAPRRYATAFRLGQLIYYNATRLCEDACTLYEAGAYPSAYALAVLAQEEVGKFEMLDHILCETVLNTGSYNLRDDWMEMLFNRGMFYSHFNKQAWSTGTVPDRQLSARMQRQVAGKKLDIRKQDALYVGFREGRIRDPQRFGAREAHAQIEFVFHGIVALKDVPFREVFEDPDDETKAYANENVAELQARVDALVAPAKRTKRHGSKEPA